MPLTARRRAASVSPATAIADGTDDGGDDRTEAPLSNGLRGEPEAAEDGRSGQEDQPEIDGAGNAPPRHDVEVRPVAVERDEVAHDRQPHEARERRDDRERPRRHDRPVVAGELRGGDPRERGADGEPEERRERDGHGGAGTGGAGCVYGR